MWLHALILALLGAQAAIGSPYNSHGVKETELQGIIDTLVNETINELVATLNDPLTFNSSYDKYNNAILTGWTNTTDLTLTGLRSIAATAISIKILSPTSLNLTLKIEDLNLFLNYDCSLILGQVLPFYGTGNISANLDGFSVSFYALANITTNPLGFSGLKNTTVGISVGENTYLKINGLWRNDSVSDLINDFLETFLSRFIAFLDSNQARISNVLSPIVQDLLDYLFN